MAIKTFSKARMRAATHITIMRNCLQYANSLAGINDERLRGLIVSLAQRIDREDNDYHVAQGSQYTAQIADADDMRDRAWGMIINVSRSFTMGYGTSEQTAAAELILKLVNDHKVNVSNQFVQETGEINEFIQHADAHASEFSLLALDTVYSNLKKGNNDVNDYIMKRQDERAHQPVGALKESRAATDAAYEAFTDYVDALNVVMPSPVISKFIQDWNSYVDYMRKQILNEGAQTSQSQPFPPADPDTPSSTTDPSPAPEGSSSEEPNPTPSDPTPSSPEESGNDDGGFGI